jgi:hypothetical protein
MQGQDTPSSFTKLRCRSAVDGEPQRHALHLPLLPSLDRKKPETRDVSVHPLPSSFLPPLGLTSWMHLEAIYQFSYRRSALIRSVVRRGSNQAYRSSVVVVGRLKTNGLLESRRARAREGRPAARRRLFRPIPRFLTISSSRIPNQRQASHSLRLQRPTLGIAVIDWPETSASRERSSSR